MNKKVSFNLGVIGILSLFIIGGCSSNDTGSTDEARVYDVPDCVFPDLPSQPAPEWICDESIDTVSVAAVGSYEKSAAGLNFMEQQAATAARVKLAQQIQVEVQNMIKQYTETTGAGDAETVDRVNTSVTRQITDQRLAGTRIVKKTANTNGTLYVLVGVDEDQLRILAKQSILTSMDNDQALWQQFRAEQSFDELAEEIANQRAN